MFGSAMSHPATLPLLRRLLWMHQADGSHVAGRAEQHYRKAWNWWTEGAFGRPALPDLSDFETARSDNGDRPHLGVDDDLNLPVIKLGFAQINGHLAHASLDLRETAHLPATGEANLAHRGRDLKRLLTPPRRRREFDRWRQALKHKGDIGVRPGAQQPVKSRLKRVQIHLAAGNQALHCFDPALPQVLRDRKFGLGWEPVVAHASTLSPDPRAAATRSPAQSRSASNSSDPARSDAKPLDQRWP